MGRFERRYWDTDRFTSRPARKGDDPTKTFDAFVPHHLAGWSPELDSDTVERIMAAERSLQHLNARCDSARVAPARRRAS